MPLLTHPLVGQGHLPGRVTGFNNVPPAFGSWRASVKVHFFLFLMGQAPKNMTFSLVEENLPRTFCVLAFWLGNGGIYEWKGISVPK